jgi:SOUL heme-binding protein
MGPFALAHNLSGETPESLSPNANVLLQVEGYFHLARQLGNPQTTPNLETPSYRVLKKTGEYEVREYDPFLVAETSMPLGVGPASGDGFQTLASYLFGANNR